MISVLDFMRGQNCTIEADIRIK